MDKGTLTYPAVQDKDGKWVASNDFKGIPNLSSNWRERRDFEGIIAHDESEEPAEYTVDFTSDGVELEASYRFNCFDCADPGDVNGYLQSWVSNSYDEDYDTFVESIRLKLVDEGYIAKSHFDQKTKELEDHKFKNFEFMPMSIKKDWFGFIQNERKLPQNVGQFWRQI